MDITYRSLRTDEAREYQEMRNALDYETEYMMYEPGERKEKACDIEHLRERIQSSLDRGDLLLVAECNDEIVGYLSVEKGTLNRILHTAYIVVGIRKAYRGNGIGTEFFKRLDLWAEEKQVTRLELTVMCQNVVAKRLYEKNGFVIEGIRKNSMKVNGEYVDEYYMAKLR